jgi:ketosteroid isomerase-like protein
MTASIETPLFDEAEVASALQSFVIVLEDPDPRKRASIYTEDATFLMPGAPLLQGREEMLQRLANGTVLRSVTITPYKIEGRHDLAYAHGLFTCSTEGTEERPGGPVALRFLMVLRKELDGAWRIAREFLGAESPSSQADSSA